MLIEILWLAAPTSPQNVTVLVLNPTTVEVQWLPPQEFNDESVWYEVHWCTEGMVAGVRQKTDEDIMNTASLKNVHRANLKNLLPGQTYRIWVCYSIYLYIACTILLVCNTSTVITVTCSDLNATFQPIITTEISASAPPFLLPVSLFIFLHLLFCFLS